MDVGSAAALYAGSVLVKKTFEAVAQRSLSSLFTRLNVRFRGQIELQLQLLQKELESRLQASRWTHVWIVLGVVFVRLSLHALNVATYQ